jgi:hypothetical protein
MSSVQFDPKPLFWAFDVGSTDPDWWDFWQACIGVAAAWEGTGATPRFISGTRQDIVSNLSKLGSPTVTSIPGQGPSFGFNGTDGWQFPAFGGADIIPTKRVTYLIVRRLRQALLFTVPTSFGIFSLADPDRAGGHYPYSTPFNTQLVWDFGGSSSPNRILTAPGTYTPTTNVECFAFVAGSRGSAIYLNGQVIGSQSTALTRTKSNTVVGIGTGQGSGTEQGNQEPEDISFFAILDAEWTQGQVIRWTQDPYAPLRCVTDDIAASALTAALIARGAMMGKGFAPFIGTVPLLGRGRSGLAAQVTSTQVAAIAARAGAQLHGRSVAPTGAAAVTGLARMGAAGRASAPAGIVPLLGRGASMAGSHLAVPLLAAAVKARLAAQSTMRGGATAVAAMTARLTSALGARSLAPAGIVPLLGQANTALQSRLLYGSSAVALLVGRIVHQFKGRATPGGMAALSGSGSTALQARATARGAAALTGRAVSQAQAQLYGFAGSVSIVARGAAMASARGAQLVFLAFLSGRMSAALSSRASRPTGVLRLAGRVGASLRGLGPVTAYSAFASLAGYVRFMLMGRGSSSRVQVSYATITVLGISAPIDVLGPEETDG